jgi:ribosomal-protein-alanine N-acetyltransferase
MTIFESERLLVRQFKYTDLDDLYRLNSDEEAMQYIRLPQNKEETSKFLEENMTYYGSYAQFGRWAILEKSSGDFIGSFMLRPSQIVPPCIEMGYAFLKEYWNRGFATESVKNGLIYGFWKLKLSSVIAITHPENWASKNVLLKTRFSPLEDREENGRLINLFQINKPMIETNRLLIAPLDAEELYLYLQDDGQFEKSLQLPYTGRTVQPEIKDRVMTLLLPKMTAAKADFYLYYTFWIVLEKTSGLIVAELGFKGAPDHLGEIEIGYGTLPRFRSRGFMTESVGGIISWVRQRPEVQSIQAETDRTNLASIKIVQKNSFQLTGKRENMLWWKLDINRTII